MIGAEEIRVMIVDDSSVLRGLLARALKVDPSIIVAATAPNGRVALEKLQRTPIDVVLLDIEMPEMDGITALPLIRKQNPEAVVIVMSALSLRAAEVTIRLLSAGAHDFLPKPTSQGGEKGRAASLGPELIRKIKTHMQVRAHSQAPASATAESPPTTQPLRPSPNDPEPTTDRRPDTAPTRTPSRRPKRAPQTTAAIFPHPDPPLPPVPTPGAEVRPRILAIGSSTGGPNALDSVIGSLSDSVHAPILITQHMPPMFTTILARRLDGLTHRRCVEGAEGMKVQPDTIYLAPGDYHMTVKQVGSFEQVICIDQNEPVNFCRPAVDCLFHSVSATYGSATLAIVLTGMGEDGCDGARAISTRGGTVWVQDLESSVVWGMPGAVANAGLAQLIIPLHDIGKKISKRMGNEVTA